MKMLMITEEVTSEYFHIYIDRFLFKIALTALKYETPIFQESCLFNNCFIFYMGLCKLYALFIFFTRYY